MGYSSKFAALAAERGMKYNAASGTWYDPLTRGDMARRRAAYGAARPRNTHIAYIGDVWASHRAHATAGAAARALSGRRWY
jgi:hypothetical protein